MARLAMLRLAALLSLLVWLVHPAQALEAGIYRLGFLTSAAGPLALEAESFRRGAQLAVAQINAGGLLGPGTRLDLAERDAGDDAAQAVRRYDGLLADPRVMAVACCVRTASAAALAPLARRDRIPLVLYGAGGGELAAPPFVYSVAGWPAADEPGLLRRMARALGARNAAYFMPADDAGLRARAAAARAALEKAGLHTLGTAEAPSADTDMTVPATRLAALRPDLIVLYATALPSGRLVAALRGRGWQGAIAATDALAPAALFARVGPVLAGVPFAADFAVPDPARGAGGGRAAFTRAYEAMFAGPPDPYGARGYTAVWLVAQALRTLPGQPDRAALARAMARLGRLDADAYDGMSMRGGQMVVRSPRFLAWTADGGLARWTRADAAD
ncbi:MAG: amino acid ABC transporter substrate-binding protein [Rhodospirillales bacterium]|nr:amino acid ABC transporter substrate-binding protein [Rhodospirillales bacterium]